MGPDRKTVITLDLGLYKPAKQLQMARKDYYYMSITITREYYCYT